MQTHPTTTSIDRLRASIECARGGSPAGTVPDWWTKLGNAQRRAYLARHPRSRLKNIQTQQITSNLKPNQKAGLTKFLGTLAGPDGALTKKVRERVQPENIKPKDKPKIANLVRAAHGDAAALKAIGADYDAMSPEEKRAHRLKHGTPLSDAAIDERDRAAAEAKAKAQANPSATQTGPQPMANKDYIRYARKERAEGRKPAPAGTLDKDGKRLPDDVIAKRKPQPGREDEAPTGGTDAPDTTDAPGGEPNPPEAPGPAPKGGKKPKQDLGYEAAALTMASVGLMVVGGTALVALGVPVACFTPDLIKDVWQGIRPDKNDDVLVGNLCKAIQTRMQQGYKPKELEDSLLPNEDQGKKR